MPNDEILKAELEKAVAECERLREENALLRLRIGQTTDARASSADQSFPSNKSIKTPASVTADAPPELKISLFRSLFRGRDDVYALRWEGRSGKTGYSPAGIRDWDHAGSASPSHKKSLRHTKLFPLNEGVIRDHLTGKQTIGIYPLLLDDTCCFVAVDFDKKSWAADACAFLRTCHEVGLAASLERSRSGNGAHVWIFFTSPIHSALARKLASALLTRTMEQRYALGLDSYDRLFPSQDTMPKGGFGNLIALPLQRGPRNKGNSVFLDEQLAPHEDQWAFLSSFERLAPDKAQALLRKLYPSGNVINVKHSDSDSEEASGPWLLPPSGRPPVRVISEPLPPRISISLGDLIYIEKKGLPDAFLDRLIRLAAFQNPEFYRTQAMRLSTFGKPRVISCAEDLLDHIALPRGSLQEALDLFQSHNIAVDVIDHRFSGIPFDVDFHGDIRALQTEAAKTLAAFDDGILCPPTAFGKTAVAAQLIAMRKVNTLLLVHRRHLMDQWRSDWRSFLELALRTSAKSVVGNTCKPESWT